MRRRGRNTSANALAGALFSARRFGGGGRASAGAKRPGIYFPRGGGLAEPPSGERGFTLLEVMVALAILALSLTVISQSDVNSVRAVGRAKQLTIATQLARWLMVDTEDSLFDEGFQDFEEEKKGNFDEQGFKQFRYRLKIDKIELPPNLNAQSLSDAVSNTGAGAGSGSGSHVGGMFQAGAKMMGQQFEMIRNVLEQSIRRVTVHVLWKESGRDRFISVTGYFTDPRKVDAAGGGLLGAAAAAAGNASKSSGGTTTTTGAGSPAGIRTPSTSGVRR